MATDPVEVFCRALWRREHATIAALASRVDPNAKDKWGNTPLLSAAQYGDLALVELLVLRGGEVDQGRTHLTPLTLAAGRNASDIVSFLRDKGAAQSIVTLIYLGDRERFALELRRPLAKLRDEAGDPILLHAVEALRPDMVELLLEQGATVSDTDPDGETALHRVADMRRAPQGPAAKMATLLLDRGGRPQRQEVGRCDAPAPGGPRPQLGRRSCAARAWRRSKRQGQGSRLDAPASRGFWHGSGRDRGHQ